MGQLEEIERTILEGDVEVLTGVIDQLTGSTDFDLL